MIPIRPRPLKTRQQLKSSIVKAISLAAVLSAPPALAYLEYQKHGYIFTGEDRLVTAQGDEALLIINGMAVVAVCAWIFALYTLVSSLGRLHEQDYSDIDEDPDFLVCLCCEEPQRSGEVLNGRCSNCLGDVEAAEGFYDRHPELIDPEAGRAESAAPNVASSFVTCTECGKTFWSETCAVAACPDCSVGFKPKPYEPTG